MKLFKLALTNLFCIVSLMLSAQESDIKNFLEQPENQAKFSHFYKTVPDWVWCKLAVAQRNGEKANLFVMSNQDLEKDSLLYVRFNESTAKNEFFLYLNGRIITYSNIHDLFMNQFVLGELKPSVGGQILPTVNHRYARISYNDGSFEIKGNLPSTVGYSKTQEEKVIPVKLFESNNAQVFQVSALLKYSKTVSLTAMLNQNAREFMKLCTRCGILDSYGNFSSDALNGPSSSSLSFFADNQLPLTFFIPSNKAILEAGELQAMPVAELREILLHHIVINENLFVDGDTFNEFYNVPNYGYLKSQIWKRDLNTLQILSEDNKLGIKHPNGSMTWVNEVNNHIFPVVVDNQIISKGVYSFNESRECRVVHMIDTVLWNGFLTNTKNTVYIKCSTADSAALINIHKILMPTHGDDYLEVDNRVKFFGRQLKTLNYCTLFNHPNAFRINTPLSSYLERSVGELTELEGLFFSNNEMSGPMPLELKNCKKMYLLDLDNNMYTSDEILEMQATFGLPFSYTSNKSKHAITYKSLGDSTKISIDDKKAAGIYTWQVASADGKQLNKTTYKPIVSFLRSDFIKGSVKCTIDYPKEKLHIAASLAEITTLDIDTIRTTVHWSGEKTVDKMIVVADSGRLIVDAGAVITFNAQCYIKLIDNGCLDILGTEKQRIELKTSSESGGIYTGEQCKSKIQLQYCDLKENIVLGIRSINYQYTKLQLDHCTISGTKIRTEGASLIITNSAFQNNPGAYLDLNNNSVGVLDKNTFTQSGSILSKSSDLTVKSSIFENMLEGNIIYQQYNNLDVDSCSFMNNNLGNTGRVINCQNTRRANITNSVFTNNIVNKRNDGQYEDGVVINYVALSSSPYLAISGNVFKRNGNIDMCWHSQCITIKSNYGNLHIQQNKIYLTFNCAAIYISGSKNKAIISNNEIIGNLNGLIISQINNSVLAGNIIASSDYGSLSTDYSVNNIFDAVNHSSPITYGGTYFCNNICGVKIIVYEEYKAVVAHNVRYENTGNHNVNSQVTFKNPVRFDPNLLRMDEIDEELLDSLENVIAKADYRIVNSNLLIDAGEFPAPNSFSSTWNSFVQDFLKGTDVYGNPRLMGNGIDIGAVEHSFANPSKLSQRPEPLDSALVKKYLLVPTVQAQKFALDFGVDRYVYKDSMIILSPDYIMGGANPLSYFWNNETHSNASYANTLSESKEYVLTIKDANNCTATDTVKVILMSLDVNDLPTGGQQVDIVAFHMNSKTVSIESKTPIVEKTQLYVYDVNGRMLDSVTVMPFDHTQNVVLSGSYSVGVYILKYNNPLHSVSKKIIITK